MGTSFYILQKICFPFCSLGNLDGRGDDCILVLWLSACFLYDVLVSTRYSLNPVKFPNAHLCCSRLLSFVLYSLPPPSVTFASTSILKEENETHLLGISLVQRILVFVPRIWLVLYQSDRKSVQ